MQVPKIFDHEFTEARFWGNVEIKGEDECWPWIGWANSFPSGSRGVFYFMGKQRIAARIIVFGPKAESPLHALHRCNNSICVNPKHLYPGTAWENGRDRILKRKAEEAIRKKKYAEAQMGRQMDSYNI